MATAYSPSLPITKGGTSGPIPYNPNLPLASAYPAQAQPPVGKIRGAFNSSVDEIKKGFAQAGSGSSNPLVGLESGIKVTEGAIGAITSPLAPLMTPVQKGIDYAADKISDIPAVQRFATTKAGENTARAAEDIRGLSTIAGTAMGGPEGIKAAPELATKFGETFPNAGVRMAGPTVAEKLQGVAKDWQRPAEMQTPTYKKVRATLQKSPETPKFLAEQGLNPFAHIENGEYHTSETAQDLRDTAGKMSSDTLRPSLQMADYSTPPTPPKSIIKAALDYAESSYTSTVDDVEAIKLKIQNKVEALQRKYPNGMSLTDMNDEGIKFNKGGGFSPVKDPAVNNNAIANRALGDSLASMVEKTAPKDVPVSDFKSYQAKYYQAANYLDELNGKKAPATLGQSVARGVAKFGGAAIARHVLPVGGELVSSFAGYQIGKALEHAVENLTNPMRDSFLKNLQITNPEAFQKVAQYVGETEARRATTPRLNAPEPNGTEKNPIITPAPTTFESPAQSINRENPGQLLNLAAPGENPIQLPGHQNPSPLDDKYATAQKNTSMNNSGIQGQSTIQIPSKSRLASVNNNPGNLRFAGQDGAVKGQGGFAKFPSPEAGYEALKNQIKVDAQRGLTLEKFIHKFAPPKENNTALYIKQVSQKLGVSPKTKISEIDLEKLAQSVALKESGTKIG